MQRAIPRLVLLVAAVLGCGNVGPAEIGEPGRVEPASPPVHLDDVDVGLQAALERAVEALRLGPAVRSERLAVALVDLSDPGRTRYAGLNDDVMMYAASMPKVAVLLAAFEAIESGRLDDTPALRRTLTDMIRVSSNPAATRVIRALGFPAIAATLQAPRYALYDREGTGGLWVGKAYDPEPAVARDPLFGFSHGATARQAARFFVMLDRGLLVNPERSREMLEMLGDPGIEHKFVRGLAGRPDTRIFRKSGTYRTWHADVALVEHGDHRYVAAGIVEDPMGGSILAELIGVLDDIVVGTEPAPR